MTWRWAEGGEDVMVRKMADSVYAVLKEAGVENERIGIDVMDMLASGGNPSPYRRWHTDKLIRQGDLVIVDINQVGPGGYFNDYVRTFLVDAEPTKEIKGLYRECYDSMYAGLEMLRPGNTTADV